MTVDIGFALDRDRCVRCGACVEDCVAGVLDMTVSGPSPARADECIGCQHCLAVCPKAVLTIWNRRPGDSLPAASGIEPGAMKRLMLGRRSIRHFKDEDLPPELLRELVDVAWNAPTGVNSQNLHFSVTAERGASRRLRAVIYDRLAAMVARGGGVDDRDFWGDIVDDWRNFRRDMIFRGAPHVLFVAVGPDAACPDADPFIALSYLELYAHTLVVGATWCGMWNNALSRIDADDVVGGLGIPEGYRLSYCMLLGWPKYSYPRCVQRGPAPLTMCAGFAGKS